MKIKLLLSKIFIYRKWTLHKNKSKITVILNLDFINQNATKLAKVLFSNLFVFFFFLFKLDDSRAAHTQHYHSFTRSNSFPVNNSLTKPKRKFLQRKKLVEITSAIASLSLNIWNVLHVHREKNRAMQLSSIQIHRSLCSCRIRILTKTHTPAITTSTRFTILHDYKQWVNARLLRQEE